MYAKIKKNNFSGYEITSQLDHKYESDRLAFANALKTKL